MLGASVTELGAHYMAILAQIRRDNSSGAKVCEAEWK